jgi:translation elongation factor EF-1alpha
MISNTLSITNVIFVVSANPIVFNESLGEIKEILKRCELLNVKRILFAINFMDGNIFILSFIPSIPLM